MSANTIDDLENDPDRGPIVAASWRDLTASCFSEIVPDEAQDPSGTDQPPAHRAGFRHEFEITSLRAG